jgi:hypothetical protein
MVNNSDLKMQGGRKQGWPSVRVITVGNTGAEVTAILSNDFMSDVMTQTMRSEPLA